MQSHRNRRTVMALAAALSMLTLAPGLARAHHVVWVDLSGLSLSAFPTVNGNTPATATDIAQVKAQVFANMVEDYAPFDITLTSVQPAHGRYTRVAILDTNQGGLFGCAGGDCCPSGGTCTGIGSWASGYPSQAEIYAGSFSTLSDFSGTNATTARIANGISHTASHELGHILDLSHCNAADDSITLGCSDITSTTGDSNVKSHIMASGASWGLTSSERATVDRFFSIHASRRILLSNLQTHNHFLRLPNLNGGTRDDLLYGRFASPSTTTWFRRLSSSTAFTGVATASSDAGDSGDVFLTGDVTGDGREDLVYGRFVSSTQVRWYVRASNSSGLLVAPPPLSPFSTTIWRSDAGDVGDIFRLADVNNDGRADLVYGRPLSSDTVQWYVRLSTGTSFGDATVWKSDAGDEGHIFLLGDVDADGDADLVYGSTVSDTQVRWYARRSNGTSFGARETWRDDAGDRGDLFYLQPVGDSDADLIYGRVKSDTQVTWYVRGSTGSGFSDYAEWASDAGDAGDLFRLGDGNGDGRCDLMYGRSVGMNSLTATPDLSIVQWYGRLSNGGGFNSWTTWCADAGDEGDIFP